MTINGGMRNLWRAADHEGEVLEQLNPQRQGWAVAVHL